MSPRFCWSRSREAFAIELGVSWSRVGSDVWYFVD